MASRGFIELLRLADLANARATGRNNPDHEDWLGVVFEVAGIRQIAPLGEVSEVLALPDLTTMPLTKPWLLGVANVRGRLLPLTDLAEFLGIQSQERLKNRKVLVIDKGETFAGLLVDQVLGISRFTVQHYKGESLETSPFAPYQHGIFNKDDESLPVFMPSLLIQDPNYQNAALQ